MNFSGYVLEGEEANLLYNEYMRNMSKFHNHAAETTPSHAPPARYFACLIPVSKIPSIG